MRMMSSSVLLHLVYDGDVVIEVVSKNRCWKRRGWSFISMQV